MKTDRHFALSPAEEQLWLQWILEPENPNYNIQSAIRIVGEPCADVLALCCGKLVKRHEALRSVYRELEGSPVRVIVSSECVNYEKFDFSRQPSDECRKNFSEILKKHENSPFDLSNGPLIRFSFFKFGGQEHVLAITAHHIVVDARSLDLIYKDLGALYSEMTFNEPLIRDVEYQLSDFTDLQIRKMESDCDGSGLQYWKQRFGEDLLPFLLPHDYTPDCRGHQGARITTAVPLDLLKSFRTVSRSHSCSLYATAAAALLAACHRISERERVILGTNVSCRIEPGTEDIIGLCINMLPLFSDISGDTSFKELIVELQKQAISGLQHNWVPLSSIFSGCKTARRPGLDPLIPFVFNLYRRADCPFRTPSLKSDYLDLETNFSRFDIVMTMAVTEDSAQLNVTFNTSLYSRETIESLSEHYLSTAEVLLKNPDRKFKEVFRSATLRDQSASILWNPALSEEEYPLTVVQAFERQVKNNGSLLAVADAERELNYRELDSASDSWAWQLLSLGVKNGDVVGLVFEPSVDMIIAILAVLKTGAAYAPLDPSWPTDRITQIINLIFPHLILNNVDEHAAKNMSSVKWINFSDFEVSSEKTEFSIKPDNRDLAYVLFTSGSTGTPKAVAVEHAQVIAYTMGVISNLKLKPRKSWPVVCTYSADITVTPLFGALMTGGLLIMLSKAETLDAGRIASWRQRYQMDYLKLAPSHMSALLDQDPDGTFLPSEMAIIGGELLTWELVDKIRSCPSSCRIGNHYSPCETTCGILTNDVTETEPSRRNTGVPMGTPLPGVCVTVGDRYLTTVAKGLPGEIIISGRTVTRGYLNNQELTASKFLDLPWHKEHHSRCYRSGDIGRLNPESRIEFIYRRDNQVKIRGFRVELNEVERILERHPSVSQAGISPLKGRYENEGLVAFIRPVIPDILSQSELREFTRSHLPDYMVPTLIVCRSKLPLNHNGKLDRFKLAADTRAIEEEYFRKQGEAIHQNGGVVDDNRGKIRKAWEKVLGTEKFSDSDKFFDVGGDSIKLMRVYSELHGSLEKELSIADLFTYNTVTELVEYCERNKSSYGSHEDFLADIHE